MSQKTGKAPKTCQACPIYSETRTDACNGSHHKTCKRYNETLDKVVFKNNPFKALQKAAFDCGGTLIVAKLKPVGGQNGGCGSPTHVSGTNGGTISCGSMLTSLGKTEPYYCAHCSPGQ